jgi:4-amino-4-deoxychorismate lyase
VFMINGEQGGVIHAMDRAVMYGDGVFRTMRMRQGQVKCWPQQYRKLNADCQALDILCPAQHILEQELSHLALEEPDCVVKIIVSRGEGGRGYSVPASVSPNRVVLSSPAPQYPIRFWHEGVKLHVCEIRMSHQPRLAGIKHLNRLENVLARMEWDDAGIPEGLLLDADGWVVEGTMSNIFIRVGRKLITPDLSTCGVAGLQRDRILKHAPSLGLTPEISRFTLPTLLQAEEIFVCNSVIGVWPVRQIGATSIAPGPIATQMQRILESEID